jgi:hypothetical protein
MKTLSTIFLPMVAVLLLTGVASAGNISHSECRPTHGTASDHLRSPADACVQTLRDRICKLSSETCCFRQCALSLTGKMYAESAPSESIQTEIAEVVRRNLAAQSRKSAVDSADYLDSCSASCRFAVYHSLRR